MDNSLLDSTQLQSILTNLRKGTQLELAVRSAHVSWEDFRCEMEGNDEVGVAVYEAMQRGRESQRQARTYADDPEVNEDDPPKEPKPKKRGKASDADEKAQMPWERIEREAHEIAPVQLGYFLWLNEKCAAMGMHRASPWWLQEIEGFYSSGKRWMLARCGRGSGKSTTLVRIAAAEALFGERVVPPGQNWIWPFVSINTTDASRRIPEIIAILNCLGHEHKLHRAVGKQSIDMLDRNGQQVSFLSIACNIGALSGPTAIGGIVDEEAKLLDKSTNANPASEIIASMIQTFRGHDVRAIRCSSAWTESGSHFDTIKAGDTSQNYIARLGEAFVEPTVSGLLDVAEILVTKGDKSGAERLRSYVRTIDATSPNIPTWIANPTRTAVGCYEDCEAMPAASRGKVSLLDYFLRENASVSLKGGAGSAGSNTAIGCAEMSRAIVTKSNASKENDGLRTFPNLPSYDPRSQRYRPDGSGGGSGRGVL